MADGYNSGEELFSEVETLETVEQLQTKYGPNVTYNGRKYIIATSDSDTSSDIESTSDNCLKALKNSSKPTNALNTSTPKRPLSKNIGKSVSKPPLPTLTNSKRHSMSISPSSSGSVTPTNRSNVDSNQGVLKEIQKNNELLQLLLPRIANNEKRLISIEKMLVQDKSGTSSDSSIKKSRSKSIPFKI